MSVKNLSITLNEAKHQFELRAEGFIAYEVFERFPGGIAYLHTLVPAEWEGLGVDSRLAKHVLDYAQAQHLKVRPDCPFISAYIDRHPEFQSLLVADDAPSI